MSSLSECVRVVINLPSELFSGL